MKIFTVLFCLLVSGSALAQSRDTSHKDISRFIIIDAKPTNNNEKFLSIVDGQEFWKTTIGRRHYLRDTSNILDVKILKGKEAKDKYGKRGSNGIVIVTTKKYAITSYQKKFSAFSKEYKKYLDDHQGGDEDCGYQLDGTFIYGKSNEDIRKLYGISDKKIKKVKFLENPFYNGGESKKMLVLIITKK